MDVNSVFVEFMGHYDRMAQLVVECPELVTLGIISDFDYKTWTTIKGRLDRKFAKTVKGIEFPDSESFTYRSTRGVAK